MIILGKGMVGSAIQRCADGHTRSFDSKTVDLLNIPAINTFIRTVSKFDTSNKFFFTAGKVGGIDDNINHNSDYLIENSVMAFNFIDALVKNLSFSKSILFSSSCVYSPDAQQPFMEWDYFKYSTFEKSNEGYALAKMSMSRLAMMVMKNHPEHKFKIVVPCNIFGTNDKFNETNSHVVGALIHKFCLAKTFSKPSVEIWGSGNQRRELLHEDDIGKASNFIMENYEDIKEDVINIGCGYDISIREIAEAIREALNVDCEIIYNKDKPVGMPTKLLSTKVLSKYGWFPEAVDIIAIIKSVAQDNYRRSLNHLELSH